MHLQAAATLKAVVVLTAGKLLQEQLLQQLQRMQTWQVDVSGK